MDKLMKNSDMLSLCLLTDTHYTEDGTWKDTASAVSKVVNTTHIDAIVHLGDFTDGLESKDMTRLYVKRILSDLKKNELPVYVTVGNHDYNFYKGNKERFSKQEVLECLELEKEYYYQDFDKYKIRCLFLFSYDADVPVRYGFSDEEVAWIEDTLYAVPSGYKVIIFSHGAPLYFLDYWSRIIRNSDRLMNALEEYNALEDRQILAFIHGHTHAEHVYEGSSFPIISIGSNKCEQLVGKIPKGSYAHAREKGTDTQDLWDVLQVDSANEKLYFYRIGAGEDRVIDCRKSVSTWREDEAAKKQARTTKIWAHRGSSGFAPENTLPAFAIAKALNVDGIELDVQMTKDGERVVIHDETIDRTSDGSGWVKDFTLEELRQFNFNNGKSGFGFVTIPTLREVYEMFQDTDYMINVELKTSVIPYDGRGVSVVGVHGELDTRCIEEKVHELTLEMGMEKQVIYSSFSHTSILTMQEYVTEEQTAFLFSDGWLNVVDYAKPYNVQALHPDFYYRDLARLIKEAHGKGMKVHTWTVNEEKDALKLRDMGVDAIITNHPGKMRELYANK